jgi:hypothetical protein
VDFVILVRKLRELRTLRKLSKLWSNGADGPTECADSPISTKEAALERTRAIVQDKMDLK